MGREARCTCRWGDREGRVTALLESSELIVRGDIRARAARDAMRHVTATADRLTFDLAGERVERMLGLDTARRWAKALRDPLPTLAEKLGISAATRVCLTGPIDDDSLREAVKSAATAPCNEADLAIIRTDDRVELTRWLASATLDGIVAPTWIVYTKGRGAPLGESAVRDLMRQHGLIDTKVVAVSATLTALRFVKAKGAARRSA